jgi:hypothetical protein
MQRSLRLSLVCVHATLVAACTGHGPSAEAAAIAPQAGALTQESFCAGGGVGEDGATCPGALAAAYFAQGLCACQGIRSAGPLHVVPFDSRTGDGAGAGLPGPWTCDCTDPVDVGALVADAATHNDNAALGLAPDQLADVRQHVSLELPCGRYYLQGITASAGVTLFARGRVALFVDGDVTTSDDLHILAAPGADLDVFVRGNFNSANTLTFGDITAPARARLWLGGAVLGFSGDDNVLAGNIYAPQVDLALSGELEVVGALVARSIAHAAALTVRYDASVRDAGGTCGPATDPPPDPEPGPQTEAEPGPQTDAAPQEG